jgi:acyl transferase domain-containing protein
MLPAMDSYLNKLRKMQTTSGKFSDVLFLSTVAGQPIWSAEKLGVAYWVQNAVQPVLLSDACRGGASEDEKDIKQLIGVLIEVGPHGALVYLIC